MIFDSRYGSFANRMRQGALQTALAVTIGLLLSLAAGRVLAQILYQVSPSDPFALVASGAMLACFFPARRATYVEPLQALRTE
jgi:putative ABC transport system permease protein